MSAPRTVVYIADSEKIGGGTEVLKSLVTGLDPTRYRSVIVAPRRGALTDWADSRAVAWAEVPFNPHAGSIATLRRVAALARVFVRERADVVHAHSPLSYHAAGLAGALTGVKRICHLHFPLRTVTLEWSLRFGVDAVITCYEQLARDLAVKVRRPPRLVPILNTVDLERFAPATTAAHAAARARLRAGADHVVVIVGHLSDVKGYPTFLNAAAQIRARLPGTRFLAIGGETIAPGYGARLRQLASQLQIADAVDFLGWRDDVPDVLRAADVMVLPSLAEGLPLAVLEAMACGLPVVATNVNGTPEAIVEGETGYLIEPHAADALANRVRTLLESPALAAQMGRAGRQRVERDFTLRQFLPRVQAVYDEVLSPIGLVQGVTSPVRVK
jgi:glycosyltransferase involved in cell wall biosynthesis